MGKLYREPEESCQSAAPDGAGLNTHKLSFSQALTAVPEQLEGKALAAGKADWQRSCGKNLSAKSGGAMPRRGGEGGSPINWRSSSMLFRASWKAQNRSSTGAGSERLVVARFEKTRALDRLREDCQGHLPLTNGVTCLGLFVRGQGSEEHAKTCRRSLAIGEFFREAEGKLPEGKLPMDCAPM